MNRCPSETQWEAFVDGELAPERSREFALHLDNCPRCRALVDEMILLRAELGALPEPELPDDFGSGIMAAVREEAVPSRAAHVRTMLLASLFGAGVLIEAVVIVIRAYGVTTTDLVAQMAIHWPGLLDAIVTFSDWLRLFGEALASPRGWLIVARILGESPMVWPVCVTSGLCVILLARRFRTLKGVEPK